MQTLEIPNVTLCVKGENMELCAGDTMFKTRRLFYDHRKKTATITINPPENVRHRYVRLLEITNCYGNIKLMSRQEGAYIHVKLNNVTVEQIKDASDTMTSLIRETLIRAYIFNTRSHDTQKF